MRQSLFFLLLVHFPVHTQNLLAQNLQLWSWNGRSLSASKNASPAPLAVGSLQKAFVLKAWAENHSDDDAPIASCTPQSRCWKPAGHGKMDLVQATAQSCNAYFRELSRATPRAGIQSHLHSNGWSGHLSTDDAAIGLGNELKIRPLDLLKSYHDLVFRPWSQGERHRKAYLQGMREAALTGTAKGVRARGLWAKTGTLPSLRFPEKTCGLALVVTDSGLALLARLEPGVGREAAACLRSVLEQQKAGPLDLNATTAQPWPLASHPRSSRPLPDYVQVRLLDLFPNTQTLTVQNIQDTPIPARQGWMGPKSIQTLQPGDFVGPGQLELKDPKTGLIRRFKGRLERQGSILVATLQLQDYVLGVIHGECPYGTQALHVELGATILRFLKEGPRHGATDVCDSTHCALYIGQGPRLDWIQPNQARMAPPAAAAWLEAGRVPQALWAAMLKKGQEPGPAYWSTHCGGEPLSPHALWGNGDRNIQPCPHHPQPTPPWTRLWSHKVISKAFGNDAELSLEWPNGVWTLCVHQNGKTTRLNYDQAHRRIYTVLGWDALPSPARAIQKNDDGYVVEGVGFGHRIGLCLGSPDPQSAY